MFGSRALPTGMSALRKVTKMKSFCALLFALSIAAVHADSTNLPPANITLPSADTALGPTNGLPLQNVNGDQWSLSGAVKRPELAPVLTVEQKPNELRLGKITLSGSLVEAAKVNNPLQLINPWAPREYGESQDNATFSLITNHVTGWKLFAIEF
jgi:hypothetical protein